MRWAKLHRHHHMPPLVDAIFGTMSEILMIVRISPIVLSDASSGGGGSSDAVELVPAAPCGRF